MHRSAYQLKEADGHTFAIPRLRGPGRSAMVEIQADEYGMGVPGDAHSEIFAAAMEELGLDPSFGAYVDRLPGTTLATDNLLSMFALHRHLRGAAVGHLALFELCSVVPMSRYLTAARRVGDLRALSRFYEVHVDADVHHARLALDHMVGPMVRADRSLAPMVVFGASALARTEVRFARHVLGSWERGTTSLRAELAAQPR
ncbi:MAG: iron-containing redox enzyme family protein [Acidimicrobiales bacterium]